MATHLSHWVLGLAGMCSSGVGRTDVGDDLQALCLCRLDELDLEGDAGWTRVSRQGTVMIIAGKGLQIEGVGRRDGSGEGPGEVSEPPSFVVSWGDGEEIPEFVLLFKLSRP